MIRLTGVTKRFSDGTKSIEVLKGIDLEIPTGVVYGIIGLSGAGKSTLVRCINALERPSEGTIEVLGHDVTSLKPKDLRKLRTQIGMIFQSFNLLNSRNALGNVLLPLELLGLPKAEARARAKEMLELVGLADKAQAYPSQLSGGQKQRVAIARALATKPSVLLSDEATSALDPHTTDSILELLGEINKRLGLTVVIVTHDAEVIKKACDQVAVIVDGVVEEAGYVERVFANPQSSLAKRFAKLDKGLDAYEHDDEVWRIVFIGPSSEKPVMAKLVKDFDLEVNILEGHIDKLKNANFGHLTVSLPRSSHRKHEALEWLRSEGLKVEVVE